MRLSLAAAACALALSAPAVAGDLTPDAVRAALPKLDAIVEDVLARTAVPGIAVGVVLGDEVIAARGYGVRTAGGDDAVDADTIFQIASVSKPLASTAVAAVVGDGTLSWDSRIVDFEPGFRMLDPWVTRAVTLRDAFSHRTGMPPQAGDLLEDLGYDRDEILRRFRYLEPSGSFRADYAYTNFMLTAAGVAAANAAGTTWEDLIATRVFAPLGMTRSSGREADFYAADNRAPIHFIEDGVATARYARKPDAQSPAGGVSSTAADMSRWLVLQLNDGMFEGRRVVDAAALAATHVPQIVRGRGRDGRAVFYGLGWNVDYGDDGLVRLSHAGAFFTGARTEATLIPAEKLGIVVLANAFPTGAPEASTNAFVDTLLHGAPREDYLAIFEPIFAGLIAHPDFTAPGDPAPAMPAPAYTGLYENDYYGDAEVTQDEGGALVLMLGPGKRPFELRHLDRDAFAFDFVGLGDEGDRPALASFGSIDGATAASLTIDFLNANG
ncbi:MAG: serine hydrolase, partial [Rhizobiales bacterium]|nr:serine hydrolase [Hyphomicrobiales bacterium]